MTKPGQPITHNQALEIWQELHRLIRVGAYEERSAEHYETDTWPQDGVEESIHNLEAWAERQGLEFHWYGESKSWALEPYVTHGGVCAMCERTVTALSIAGLCEGCTVQAAMEE